MNRFGRYLAMLLLVCVVVLVWGLGTAPADYKVGAIFSVTGPASFLGDPEKKTAEMVVAQVNAAGGIDGKKIQLIVYDDEGDATKANLYARRLLTQDRVTAVIGPSQSGLTMAIIPLFEQFKTPLISCAASHKIVYNEKTGKPYHWVFKTPQSDSMAVEAIYAQMGKMGIQRIAIMSVTSGYGASGREELLRIAPEYGIEIVADEKYDPRDTDMTAQLTKIRALAPQAIVNWSIGPTQVIVLRNWRELGMEKIAFFQSHGFGSRQNIQLAAGAAEGVYLPLGAGNIAEILPDDHPQKEVTMTYLAEYTAKFNEPVSAFGGYSWDAMHLVIDALRAVGDDKAKIRDHIENRKNFVGQQGVYNFSADDHNGLTKDAFLMVVVKDGDWTLVE
ncbi:ABC transporter substrate-binding protein [Desulfatitalea alkaliphila]|uniref:ABC transporter substrate-binding protein n=1 Tax=Desulfatitalea alkaliphila TaxID=2929485 RepID=A0AA41R809_9BACT|nr:ABC transporter substrate-binding protein [Desulfatitalea alkaliphila]MCJ8502940.1 ABC transporter substrate-binding protein [Desulfatitalea alkaliphila]